jgi:hypothetical protein
LDLVLSIPAFLAEPVDCIGNVCHQVPPRVTTSAIVLLSHRFCQKLLLAGDYMEPA